MAVTAGSNAPVTPTYQKDTTSGLYFRASVPHTSGNSNRYTPVIVKANNETIDSWLRYIPPASEPLLYDLDGNLTSDGRWFYKWDGEPERSVDRLTGFLAVLSQNRLIRMDSAAQTNPTVKSMRLIFAYDGLSRRIRKDVYQDSPVHTDTATNGTLTKREHYLYDGWSRRRRLTAETDAAQRSPQGSNSVGRSLLSTYLILTALDNGVGIAGSNTGGNITKRVASYAWGPDLGSNPFGRSAWQNAGDVGGLLLIQDGINSAITYAGVDYNGAAAGLGTAPADPVDDDYFPLKDHLGNVTGLHQASYGNLALQGTLEYDAFGRELRSTGPACDKVPFHFSTKFTDPETGLNYYGYRFCDPGNGRWLGRDPIEEMGGVNLYGMVGNDALGAFDVLGLEITEYYPTKEEALHECGKKDWKESNTCPRTPGGQKPEKGGRVCEDEIGFYCTKMTANAPASAQHVNPKYTVPCESGDKYHGVHHSHPGGDPLSSWGDRGDVYTADEGKKSVTAEGKVVESETIPPGGAVGATRYNAHTKQIKTQIYNGRQGARGIGSRSLATGPTGSVVVKPVKRTF
jgi:RHS repeat-associated protein